MTNEQGTATTCQMDNALLSATGAGTLHRTFGPKVTSGALRMFITAAEVETCLNALRCERELTLLLEVFFHQPIRVIGPSELLHLESPLDRIALCDEPVDVFDLSGTSVNDSLPYQRGWLTLNLPLRGDGALRMAELNYRSAAVSAPELFQWAKKRFLKVLTRGVEVEHIDYPELRGPWNGACYSAGAKALSEQGVVWTQHQTERYYPGK